MFIITLGYIYIIVNNNIILLVSQILFRCPHLVYVDNKIGELTSMLDNKIPLVWMMCLGLAQALSSDNKI